MLKKSKKTQKKKNEAVQIPLSELNRIKQFVSKENNVDPNEGVENKQQNNVQAWAQELLKIKENEEKRLFEKFKKEEEIRMQIEKEEDERAQKLRTDAIKKANEQFFVQDERVHDLHGAMEYCDVLEGRKMQLELKKEIEERRKQIDQKYYEKTLDQMKKYDEKEEQKQQKNKEKGKQKKEFLELQIKEKEILKEVEKQLKKIERKKVVDKANLSLFEEQMQEEKQREIKKNLIIEIKQKNEEMKQIKEKELDKEKQADQKKENYNKKKQEEKNKRDEEKKLKEKEKILKRQNMIEEQTTNLAALEAHKQQLLINNIKRHEEKVKVEEIEKENRKQKLIKSIDEQRAYNINLKKQNKLDEKIQSKKFSEYWKIRNKDIEQREFQFEEKNSQIKKNFQEFNKKVAEEKEEQKKQEILQEYIQADQIKNNIILDNRKFQSYAEKCLKEWDDSGKNVTPILLELQKYKNSLIQLNQLPL